MKRVCRVYSLSPHLRLGTPPYPYTQLQTPTYPSSPFLTPSYVGSPRPLCTHPPQNKEPNPSKETKKNVESEDMRSYDLGRGEIRQKSAIPKVTTRPLNFEEAREMAQKALGQQKMYFNQKLEDLRIIFGGQPDQPRTAEQEWYYKRVSFWMKRYENFVGLTEVKAAQARVVECERKFIETQELRREAQKGIAEVQKKVKEIHLELEKTHRGEDRYLVLVTQEHQVLKEENNLLDEFKFYEKGEREYFSNLSNAVRDSHEKERAQAEKTKYWSILGSIIGTCIGIIGTTINNRLRMAELRRLVSQNSSVEEIQAIGEGLSHSLEAHRDDLGNLVGEVQGLLSQAGGSLHHLDRLESLLSGLRESSERINTKLLDNTVTQLQQQQKQLAETIAGHQARLDTRIEDIQSDLFVQNKNVGHLSHITLKDREKEALDRANREKELSRRLDTLMKQGETLESVVVSNTRDIEEKMKDVRSLLLVETQVPKFDHSRWQDKLESLEAKQLKLIQEGFACIDQKIMAANKIRLETLNAINSRMKTSEELGKLQPELQLVELDTMVHLMEVQQRKTQQAVILSALTLVILTPIAVFAINQIL